MRRRDGLDPVACCGAIRTTVLDETDAELLARTFAALADPVRLRLLSMIAATGEIGACDVVDASGRSQPTVSHHMKVLVEAGPRQPARSAAPGSGTASSPSASTPCAPS